MPVTNDNLTERYRLSITIYKRLVHAEKSGYDKNS